MHTPPRNYKYIFLVCLVFCCSFLLYFIGNGSNVFYLNSNLIGRSKEQPIDQADSYASDTEGCYIPNLDPLDVAIKDFVFKPDSFKNCTAHEEPLLKSNATHIWIAMDALDSFNVGDPTQLTCCYKGFYRQKKIAYLGAREADKRARYGRCVNFSSVVRASDEFVSVVCETAFGHVYRDYFVFAPMKAVSEPARTESGFSVVVMGIDGVSRLNFHRTMPRTLNFLKRIEAVELKGYNKVGDNTFPNLVPALMGLSENEMTEKCYPTKQSNFDGCPFVWNRYKKTGFATAFAEDSAMLATFNYYRNGFGIAPTDYYLYTFIKEAENKIGHNMDQNSYLCMGERLFYRVLLDYVLNLLNTLKSTKLFGFFWEVTVSHDYLNYPMLMDESYERFLESLERVGHLERTALVLMSDHGIRWGDIRHTKQGRLEERLPFVFFAMPPLFRETYPLAYDNLVANARSLTTPFDLHETLLDLAEPAASLTTDALAHRTRAGCVGRRGISMFLPIPGNRSCETAHIDEHWCACHRSQPLPPTDARAAEAAAFLVAWLNTAVRPHPQCAPLRLESVLEASEVEMSASALRDVTLAWRDYTVVVRAEPGAAVFEATLRRAAGGAWSLAGGVSRLNLYGEQSSCVRDYSLKLYCFCR